MKSDDFGDRMKDYEREFALSLWCKKEAEVLKDRTGTIYPYMRLDGRSFSKFTKKLVSNGIIKKPRDEVFEHVMIRATMDTVEEFNFLLGFHQSDEISLFLKPVEEDSVSQPLFGGKIQKLLSVVPSFYTARFCYHFHDVYGKVPQVSFDARICVFDNSGEATNMLVWRFMDGWRNQVQDRAHFKYGHKRLMGVSTAEKHEMIGSPELSGGNFVKRQTYELETESGPVTRSRIIWLCGLNDPDFANMSFDERKELIYD